MSPPQWPLGEISRAIDTDIDQILESLMPIWIKIGGNRLGSNSGATDTKMN